MRSKWTLLAVGGLLGSVAGVVGATISDPEVGFPAWVDLTGVLAGFALGVLVAGVFAAARASRRSGQKGDFYDPSAKRAQSLCQAPRAG